MQRRIVLFVLAGTIAIGLVATAQAGVTYTVGDVFVAIGNGQVNEYTPSGVFVQNMNNGTGNFYTTGMAFDSAGNLYVTNFNSTISKFDNSGNLVNAAWVTGQTNNESISMPGGLFPALVGDASQNTIGQYSSAGGAAINTYTVQIEDRGTDWVDLQANGKTVYYTSEGTTIFSYDISTATQNAPFATGLTGPVYALRGISSGPLAGYVLVANSANALLLNPSGVIATVYVLPGNGGIDFALNLDPTGTAFWTADLATGNVWEVRISDGAILQQWNSGFGGQTAGLAVFGEAGQGGSTPEPDTLVLFGSAVIGMAGVLRRKINL
jgi:PEP-CTERM motif